MSRLKKILIITLTLLMATSMLFTGCSKKDETSTTTETTAATTVGETTAEEFDEIITITGYLRGKETNLWEGTKSQKYIEDKFGIKLDLEFSWAYTEKYNLMFAANNLPDFFRAATNDLAFQNAGDNGQFVNYMDYLDKLPNVLRLLEKWPGNLASNISEKNGLYNLHFETEYGGNGVYWPSSIFMLRNDLLKKAGIDVNDIKTMDDFYDMLIALKEQNNGLSPIGSPEGTEGSSGTFNISNIIGTVMGAGSLGDVTGLYWNEKTEKYEGSYYRPNQKEWLEFVAKLYDEDMYNPDFKTTTKESLYVQALTGEIALSFIETSRLTEWNQDSEVEGAEWTYFLPPTYKGEQYKIQTMLSGKLYLDRGKAINAKTISEKGLERLLKFIDWLYSIEGNLWAKLGFEDEDWTVYEEYDQSLGLTRYPRILLSEANKDNFPEKYWPMLKPQEEWVKGPHMYGLKRIDDFLTNADVWHLLGKEFNPQSSLQEEANVAYKDAEAVIPSVNISPISEYEEERALIQENIKTYVDEVETKILLGQLDADNEWDNIIAKLKELKYDRLIELYNMAYENNTNKIKAVEKILGN